MRYRLSKREKIQPVEPPCSKTMYDSKEEAVEAIEHVTSKRRIKLEAYHCSVCGFWHLTKAGRE